MLRRMFTLIELLVVIAIIAILASLLLPALASEDIGVSGNQVVGNSGEYYGRNYYHLNGAGDIDRYGAVDGGASRINYSEGVFTVDSGFESHPVTYIQWYGAMAFADYYDGVRLPTEWEWESVANFDDGRLYPTGNSLIVSGPEDAPTDGIAHLHDGTWYLANYRSYQSAEHGTTPVGFFGYYGYGLADMAGNVREWTTSSTGDSVFRGGSWFHNAAGQEVSHRDPFSPTRQDARSGIRVVRD